MYLTGIVRDKQGRKMSKSLGNSPDPLELIKQYGADGVRTGMLFSSPAGNDLLFDIKLCEQGRNFANKIWNAFRLVQGWEINDDLEDDNNRAAIDWFDARFHQALEEIEDHFEKFRISDALMTTYKLIWDDFCSWYLEMIKPPYGEPIDRSTYATTIGFFEQVLKILHPFMPFLTEELYDALGERSDVDRIIISAWPKMAPYDRNVLKSAEVAFEIIQQVRNIRNTQGISPKEPLKLFIETDSFDDYLVFGSVVSKLANLDEFYPATGSVENATSMVINGDSCYIPLGDLIDHEKEIEDITRELEYTRGFLNSVSKKLSNERFVKNAPEQVVANERKKQADAETKIEALETRLHSLTNA